MAQHIYFSVCMPYAMSNNTCSKHCYCTQDQRMHITLNIHTAKPCCSCPESFTHIPHSFIHFIAKCVHSIRRNSTRLTAFYQMIHILSRTGAFALPWRPFCCVKLYWNCTEQQLHLVETGETVCRRLFLSFFFCFNCTALHNGRWLTDVWTIKFHPLYIVPRVPPGKKAKTRARLHSPVRSFSTPPRTRASARTRWGEPLGGPRWK